MGNSANSFNQNFLNDWIQIDRIRSFQTDKIIWAKKNNKSIQMEEYNLNVSSKQQLEEEQKIHSMRQNHPQLVSSLHFQDETEEQFCSSNYKGKIFIERIPLTLESITDVPFPDALHIYSQTLQGFHALTNQVESGCFPVSEQLIGVNCESVCKVWLNNKFNRNYPSRNQRITEERMVKNILDTVEENVDLGSLDGKPSPVQYIYARAKTPSEVKFGEAINLLRDYANQFFGGIIPSKVSCVDKVGGAFLLSKNWEGQNTQIIQQAHKQFSQPLPQQFPQQVPQQFQQQNINFPGQMVNSYPQTFASAIPQQIQNQNYTSFRRQEPIQKPVILGQTPINGQRSVYNNNPQIQQNAVNIPNFQTKEMQSSQANSKVNEQPSVPVVMAPPIVLPQRIQSPSVVQQVIYRNQVPNTINQVNQVRKSQFVNQQPVQQIVNQTQPVPQTQNNEASILLFNSPRREIRQNLIENRVEQVTSQKGIIFQPLTYAQPQPVIGQNPINIQQQPFQKVPLTNQVPIVQQQQTVSNVKKSTIIFNNSGQRYETQTVVKTSQVFTQVEMKTQGQSMINNSELEKVNSKLVFIDKTSPTRYSQKQDNKKKETSPSYNDYSSSYYAFTNKLYDREESSPKETEFKSSKLKTQDYSTVNYDFKPSKEQTKGKYAVNLNDGMSSPDFLNQLMNIGSSYKATDNKFDLGNSYSSYLKKDYSSPINYQTSRLDENRESLLSKQGLMEDKGLYKVDYKDYTTTLTDGVNHEDDLVVVGSKIDIAPLETNQGSGQQGENSYRMSYQYQEGQTPSGNLHYEEEILYIHNTDETLEQRNFNSNFQGTDYQEQIQQNYYEQTNYQQPQQVQSSSQQTGGQNKYQSIFDKYASLSKEQTSGEKPLNQTLQYPTDNRNLGDNIQTFNSINNPDEPQSFEQRSHLYSQELPEQYKVQFDPEILADLQRLKGVN